MIVRRATSNDFPEILKLAEQINREHADYHPDIFLSVTNAQNERNYWQTFLDDDLSTLRVAVIDDEVCGFVTVRITDNTTIPFLRRSRVSRVGTIVVERMRHGQGVGRALMMDAEAWSQQQGARELRLEVFEFNYPAQQFYTRLGFAPQSRILRKVF